MFIQIELNNDLEMDEATKVARAIINTLDANEFPDQIVRISLGGEPEIWISDEDETLLVANAEAPDA